MNHFSKTLIAATMIALSGAASAVTINSYTLDGGGVGIVFGGTPESTFAGEITVNSSVGSFATYCIELTQGLATPDSSYAFGPYLNDRLSRLVSFAGFYGGADQSTNQVNTTVEKTAFQLAIWEAVYDSAPGSLVAGTFQVSSAQAGVVAQANAYLLGAAGLTVGSYATNRLYSFSSPNRQDLVTAVPEPSTYALMLAGLAGIGFVARRRSKAANA